jgi:hypothetical protein
VIRWAWDRLNTDYWLSLGIVLAGMLVTYWYSLFHLLRSEILVYFLHAGSNNSVISLIQNTMVSSTGASDNWLFRPLGFVFLALGKVHLGFNPLAWHILSLVLFMVAVWCLYRLLWKIRPGILAMLMALFFGTMYASVNAVLYTQLISYLVFIALTLVGIFYLYRGVEESRNKDIIVATTLIFISCFLYEMGVVLLILAGVYIWLRRKKSDVSLKYSMISIASAFIAYMLAYGSFKLFSVTSYQVAELSRNLSPQSLLKGLSYIPFLFTYWIPIIVIPSAFSIFPVASLETQSSGIGTDLPVVWIALNIIAVGVIGYFAFPKGVKITNKAFPLLLGLMAFIFVCLVALYRGTDVHTGIHYIIDTNITLNMFLAWTIPLAFFFIRPDAKKVKYVALALLFLVCLSASKTFTLNYQVWKLEQPYREYVAAVDNFVEKEKAEDGFSFAFANDGHKDYIEDNLSFNWPEPKPSGEIELMRANYFQVKYYQYWNPDNPEWVVEYDGQFKAMRGE